MTAWFSRGKAPKPSADEGERLQLPGGLWEKCPSCAEIIYTRELQRNRMVCSKCGHHFRISSEQRINLLADRNTFHEIDQQLRSNDPLGFKDTIRYRDRLKRDEKKTSNPDAIRTGRAKINGRMIALGVFEFAFMGGSMGIVVGERLARLAELALHEKLPLIIVSASGGARMQEGIYSLMQMAKVSAALVRLSEARLPYISVLADPTYGGVAASFAMQGDLIIAEPGAYIGFAGRRVIEQTIHSKLPEGFQSAEFLLKHGVVDCIVDRANLKDALSRVLDLLCAGRPL